MSYYNDYEREYDFSQDDYEREYPDNEGWGYSQEDLDQMYMDAFEGDPEALWNID